jgi:uncharacterized protein involved in exopolysaccharide biosynthesis
MTPDDNVTAAASSRADCFRVLEPLRRYKKSIGLVWFLFTLTGLLVGAFAEPRYDASVTMVAADRRSVAPGAGQLGSLASLAGFSIGASSIQEPIAVLKSRRLAREFIQQNSLLPVLFSEEWDQAANDWRRSLRAEERPTLEDGVTRFVNNVRSIGEDRRTGVVTLTISWRDASVAADWANQYVSLLNSTMKNSATADLKANVEFLKSELTRSELVSLQQSIGRVLDTELQKLTVASGANEYALKVVDSASIATHPASPKKSLLLLLFGFFGLIFALGQAFARDHFLFSTHDVQSSRIG